MRKETKEAYEHGDYIERLLIALYVYNGLGSERFKRKHRRKRL